MAECASPLPSLISNPFEGKVFYYPSKSSTVEVNNPAHVVFQTEDPVLFSPLTDGLFEKVIYDQLGSAYTILITAMSEID